MNRYHCMMFQITMPIYLIAALIFVSACTPQNKKLSEKPSAPEVVKEVPSPGPTTPPTETPPTVPPVAPDLDPELKLCSKLDLEGVVWPKELTVAEWSYYALSLNITGSFEGRVGWKNISGNFDGQGLSLGLMQQNLGQGTLQPWLIEMYNQHNSTMMTNFNTADYKNLRSMLETWKKGAITAPSIAALESEELFPSHGSYNKLDIDYDESQFVEALADSSTSVSWAKRNILDSSGNVTTRWKKSFQDMAGSSGYRSFQLMASTTIFFKAKQYFEFFKFRELRSFLFLFDIVVQNGSIKQEHLAKYNSWLRSNPNASEQAKTFALLEARLTTVRPQYVQDVRSRKSTIINGTGTVHQTKRDLPKEYCFDPRVMIQ